MDNLAALSWTCLPLALPSTPLHTGQITGILAHAPSLGGIFITCGGDGMLNVLHHGDLSQALSAPPAPLPIASRFSCRPAAAAAPAATVTANVFSALFGDETPLPLRACVLDHALSPPSAPAPGVAFACSIGGQVFALRRGSSEDAHSPPFSPPAPLVHLPTPAPSALQCLAVHTLPLAGPGSTSITLLCAGAGDGNVYVWQWRRDTGAFSPAPVLVLAAPCSEAAGAGSSAQPPAITALALAAAQPLPSPSSPSQHTVLLAVGDAAGTVAVCAMHIRLAPSGACPCDVAGEATPTPCSAAVEAAAPRRVSAAAACDPLARGDLFTGSSSGVTAALWVGGFSMPAGGAARAVCKLITSGSDGRITLWSADTGSAPGGGSPPPPPLAPLAIWATGAVVRCLACALGGSGAAPAQLVSCGNTAGEVSVWGLEGVWARARGARARDLPLLLTSSDALLCRLPVAASGSAPLTALALTRTGPRSLCVIAGARNGGVHLWQGTC